MVGSHVCSIILIKVYLDKGEKVRIQQDLMKKSWVTIETQTCGQTYNTGNNDINTHKKLKMSNTDPIENEMWPWGTPEDVLDFYLAHACFRPWTTTSFINKPSCQDIAEKVL